MTTTIPAACLLGAARIRPLTPAERWQQFAQQQRAARIRRQREVPSLQQRAAAAKGRVLTHLEGKR